jgi:hypothetical protein
LYSSVDGYVDYLDGAGVWVGQGPSVPRQAVFVRRWAVLAAAADAPDTRVIVVFVRTLVADRVLAGPRPLVRGPGEIWLTAVVPRRLQG